MPTVGDQVGFSDLVASSERMMVHFWSNEAANHGHGLFELAEYVQITEIGVQLTGVLTGFFNSLQYRWRGSTVKANPNVGTNAGWKTRQSPFGNITETGTYIWRPTDAILTATLVSPLEPSRNMVEFQTHLDSANVDDSTGSIWMKWIPFEAT